MAGYLGVRFPATPAPPGPRQRRTLRHRGLPKNHQRRLRTAANTAKQGVRRNNVQIFRQKSSAEASTVHTSHRVHADLPANVGNTARGASIPTKPVECMPLPWLTTSAATSSSACEQGEKQRESTSGSRVYPIT